MLSIDSNTINGMYCIRSVYFDDYNNTCYYENVNGTEPREKFRIRIYNNNASFIRLELKRKEHGKTQKISCQITKEACSYFLNNQPYTPHYACARDTPVLMQKFVIAHRTRIMKPRVIVEYDRTPFIYKDGNVRITFDMNIRSTNSTDQFFDSNIPKRLIMPHGMHILEVKYDEFLPDHLKHCLQLDNLQQASFSKYALCRKYKA